MKLLQLATRPVRSLTSPRSIGLAFLAIVGALIPTQALAVEGDTIKLAFTQSDKIYLWISLALGAIALGYGFWIAKSVLRHSAGSEKMQEVGGAIRDGALAYLSQQIRTMVWFVLAIGGGLAALYWSAGPLTASLVALCFVLGVAASYVAGYAGMLMAVNGNMRTAHAALTSYKTSLEVAFKSGAVAGMVTVGMGLIGATLILLFAGDRATTLLVGFGFGGSLAALFMRVGGGIFTKAADVGADLVGKLEAGIPEDDPRNPATIADNVGDCAGMAADIFESYEVTLVAAIILGAATAQIFDTSTWTRLIIFALMARGVGIVASIIGISTVRGTEDLDADPLKPITKGFQISAGVALVFTLVLAWFLMGGMGNPIKTSQLVSLEKQRSETYAKIATAFKGIQKANPTPIPGQDPLEDLRKDPVVKSAGLDDPAFASSLQEAAMYNADTAPAPRALDGFRRIDLSGDSPVLKYSTIKPSTTRGAQPDFVSLKDALTGNGLKMMLVQVTTNPQPAPPGVPNAQPIPGQTRSIWLGPTSKESLTKQISEFPAAQGSAKIMDEHDVALFANDAGKLIFGVVGNYPFPLQLPRTPQIPVFKEAPDDVKKAFLTPHPGSPQPAAMQDVQLATVQENVVPWYMFWAAIGFGILMAFLIERLTDYYVSTHKKPTQEVAGVSNTGAALMIIQGFAYALESSVFMVFAIVFALIFPLFLFSPAIYGGYILSYYGIALVGLGLLTTTGYILAMDTFGPISDNAQGVYEMSGEGHNNLNGSKAVQRLDAAGNTTKALTKGFAIATAVVAAVALFHSYLEGAKLEQIGLRLDFPEIFLGMLIGGAAPYLFSAFAINAVGRASFELINEVRRQFREDGGIMLGTSKPNYARCVAIVTAAAQRELLGPGILAIALPAAVAFGFSIGKPQTEINGHMYNLVGAQALGGFLAGAILSGQLLAVLLANSGGMWDNAKKIIEDGLYGGKGSEAHKAGVICDTVGDPFKDTAGPALNPLIKVMNLVALLLAGVVIRPFDNVTLSIITITCVGLLAVSIYVSKKGSLSSEMQKATSEAPVVAAVGGPSADSGPKTAKKKLTVEGLKADSTADSSDTKED